MKTLREISIIIPVFNEAPTLKPLYHQIRDVMGIIGAPYEIIFVDDGSTDGSFGIMEEIHHLHQELAPAAAVIPRPSVSDDIPVSATTAKIIVIQFRRNMGKALALAAGFTRARGDIVITIDADLQDDPNEIPKLLAKVEEGYDVVSGWKTHRQDSWSKIVLSRIFNRVVCWCTRLNLHDINCGFKAYRREVIQELLVYGDRHRFSWALIAGWGIEGAALAFTFSRALVVLVFYCTARRLNLIRPLRVSIGKLATLTCGFLIIIAATVLLKTVVGILPWSIILSASVFVASVLFFGWHGVLTHKDRSLLLQAIKRV